MDSDEDDNSEYSPHDDFRVNLKRNKVKNYPVTGTANKRGRNTKPRFICGVCDKEFACQQYLNSHQRLHTDERNYACPQCSYKGKNQKYLSRHIKKVHVIPTAHHCGVCGKAFHYMAKLREHEMVHTGEKPYKCPHCPKSFRVSYSLKTHMFIHKEEKPYQCSFCDYACRDSSSLRKHQNKHMGLERIYNCTLCDKQFKVKAKLKVHISEYHLDINLRKHKCDQCAKAFKSNGYLMFHKRTVHDRKFAVKCPICGIKVTNKYNLQSHARTHTDHRPYTCKYSHCKKKFKDKSTLSKHVIIHEPHRHHVCNMCGNMFTRKSRLVKHMGTHGDKRKTVECHYCGVEFYTKNYLIKHIKQKHLEIQKFICDLCGLSTANKPSLIMHLKQHAHDKDRTCKICKTTLKHHKYLKIHYLRTHNVRYKIRKRKPKKDISTVEVKVEPVDKYEHTDTYNETDKQEEDETVAYSKQVLSEELAATLMQNDKNITEVDFDQFVLQNMFRKAAKQEEDSDEENENVDKELLEQANREIKEMLETAQRDLDEKNVERNNKRMDREKKKEARMKLIKEKKEARMMKVRKKNEIDELYKVIFMYNDRIQKVHTKNNKEQVKIRYFNANKDKNNANGDLNDKPSTSNDNEANLNSDNDSTENNSRNDANNKTNDDAVSVVEDNNSTSNEIQSNNDENESNTHDEPINDGNGSNDDDKLDNDRNINNNNGRITRRINVRTRNKSKVDYKSLNDGIRINDNGKRNRKFNFQSHQCYICFKLFSTKDDLIKHCQIHFDQCSETTLIKCPICNFISDKHMEKHILTEHNIDLRIPYSNIQDRKNSKDGTKYCFDANGTEVEIIPSIKLLNKHAYTVIDRKKREIKDKKIAKTKLVKKGRDWIVESEVIEVKFDTLPEFDKNDLKKLKVSDNNIERLGKLNRLAKKIGLKMGFPCFDCEKICQNFSALKLHSRKHQDNPIPFKPKVKRINKKAKETKKIDKEMILEKRLQKPKPIIGQHRCDDKLKEFYENNIRGGDIEFWQFLKIFNKIDREDINDFEELEGRTDFGMQFDTVDILNDISESNADENTNNSDIAKEINKNTSTSKTTKINTKKQALDKPKNAVRKLNVLSKDVVRKRNEIKKKMREEIRQRNATKNVQISV